MATDNQPRQYYPTEQNPNAPTQQTPQQAVNPGSIQQKPSQETNPGPIQQRPTDTPVQQNTPTQQTQTAQTTQERSGGVYKVGDNGQAPKGLSAGDQVVTAGGTYTIMSVNPDGTYRSQLTNQGQTTANYTGSYSTPNTAPAQPTVPPTGNVYRVGADGQAPKGLKVGDQVVTGGGTYIITAVNADGTYQSQLSNQGQTTANYGGSYTSMTPPSGNTYRVGADGKAPPGLNVGDMVVTGGGTYIIDAVNRDGTYVTTLIDANTGTGNYRGEYARDPNLPAARTNPAENMKALLDQWRAAAQQQAEGRIDYTVEQGVTDLTRAMEDAQPQFQEQLNKNDIDTARALDNSAMYAEARGDRGGIGQAQYNEIQAAALKNRQAVYSAQTKLATDTARQIQDLRLKGEFDKADKLLELSQNYLAQLISLEQWGAQWDTTQEQMAQELEQWAKNYELQRANVTGVMNDGTPTRAAVNDERDRAADVASALLKVGVMPNQSQLDALGMTSDQASAYIMAQGLRSYGSGGGGGGRSGGGGGGGGGSNAASATPTSSSTPTTSQKSITSGADFVLTWATISKSIDNGDPKSTVEAAIQSALDSGLISASAAEYLRQKNNNR